MWSRLGVPQITDKAEKSSAELPEASDVQTTAYGTDDYFRVHRSYMLVAGLLAAWEIIGISVVPENPSASYSDPVDLLPADDISNVAIEFQNPSASVWILVFLLLYFGVRFSLLWQQQPEEFRTVPSARIDYLLAHALALSGALIWVLQSSFETINIGQTLGSTGPYVLLIVGVLITVVVVGLGNLNVVVFGRGFGKPRQLNLGAGFRLLFAIAILLLTVVLFLIAQFAQT